MDVWALGCLAFTLAFQRHPFDSESPLQILNCKYTFPDGDKPYPPAFAQLIRDILQPDPACRPSIVTCTQRFSLLNADAQSHELSPTRGQLAPKSATSARVAGAYAPSDGSSDDFARLMESERRAAPPARASRAPPPPQQQQQRHVDEPADWADFSAMPMAGGAADAAEATDDATSSPDVLRASGAAPAAAAGGACGCEPSNDSAISEDGDLWGDFVDSSRNAESRAGADASTSPQPGRISAAADAGSVTARTDAPRGHATSAGSGGAAAKSGPSGTFFRDFASLSIDSPKDERPDTPVLTPQVPADVPARRAHSPVTPAARSSPSVASRDSPPAGIRIGQTVKVHSLKARPELNGAEACVLGWDAKKGRFNVSVSLSAPSPSTVVIALKPTNLSPARSATPCGSE